jgi:hypothetical protein
MKFKKEDIIKELVNLRTVKGLSTKSIVEDFLKGKLGYKTAYAYELMREARDKIIEIYQTENKNSINEAVGQLEELYEILLRQKNYREVLKVRQELNKLLGLYSPDKIDLTSGGEKITEIKLIQVTKDEKSRD